MDGTTAVIQQAERQQNRRSHLFNPAPKLSKVFGKSASQTPAPGASCDDLSSSTATLSPPCSPTTPITKRGKRKPQRVVSPQVVSSIVDSMYAYSVNRESNRLAPPKNQDKTFLHQKSSLRMVASRICGLSAFYSSAIHFKLHTPRSGNIQRIVRSSSSGAVSYHQTESQYSGTPLQEGPSL